MIRLVDYELAVANLKKELPFIISVAIIEGKEHLMYSNANWEISSDIEGLMHNWDQMKPQSLTISGQKYIMRQCTNDRLVATSLKREGHLIGVRDEKKAIIALIESDGIIPFTTMELARVLDSFRRGNPHSEGTMERTQKSEKRKGVHSISKDTPESEEPLPEVYFTARLMAHYRSQEATRKNPLLIDPFAKRLAGDLEAYLSKHLRASEMDYPIVRSHYIEQNLLTPWCEHHQESQIVLLGAGLDTRAYRFTPLQQNNHMVFEVDLSEVISYKEQILQKERPLCPLKRFSLDLSEQGWETYLLEEGFSTEIPTFWLIEGLLYYIEKDLVLGLIVKIADLSCKTSQIFLDLMQRSRWFESSEPLTKNSKDPFSRHFKWGIDIKEVPSFFSSTGWKVRCSFADDYDEGRDVGQKAMIFVQGSKI